MKSHSETLYRINERENIILAQIRLIHGSVEERELEMIKLQLYDLYREIHIEYTLCNCIESLKRAFFIQWYGAFEPQIYTGIGILDSKSVNFNFHRISKLSASDGLDEEFKTMLSHYYTLTEWYFDSNENTSHFKKKVDSWISEFSIPEIQKINNRGQMGLYWNSFNQ